MGTNKKLKRRFALVLAVVMALSIAMLGLTVLANQPSSIDVISAAPATVTVSPYASTSNAVFSIEGGLFDVVPYLVVGDFEVVVAYTNVSVDWGSASVAVSDGFNATLTVPVYGLHETDTGSLGMLTVAPGSRHYRSATVTFYHPAPAAAPAPLRYPRAPATHAVTFDLGGGTQTCDVELNQTVAHGGDATLPTVVRPGYTFVRWYPAGGYNNVTDSITITAHWTQTTDVPRTGDDTQLPWLHLVMSLLAIGLGASVLFLLRKKKKGESNA